MLAKFPRHHGFTIVELIITMGIFAIISSLTTVSLMNSHHSANMNAAIETLVADLSQQQNKSMVGQSATSYGIHFESQKYVLTNGASDNFDVPLGGTLEFNPIPADIFFSRGKGETPATQITISDPTVAGISRTIYLNIYGVITQIN